MSALLRERRRFRQRFAELEHELNAVEAELEAVDRAIDGVIDAERRGYTAFPGEGIGDDGQWPPERSLLILGIARDDARRLGREFGQLAIVHGEKGGPAMLLPCDLLSD
jgi:hypothetical protein